MINKSNSGNEINKFINSFNIILADRNLETFRRIKNLNSKYNFINLSSNFAVNFILEYEKIDLIIISKKISDLTNILERANRKKINVYILGKDIRLPVNEKDIENILIKEIKRKISKENSKKFNFKKYISCFVKTDKLKELILQFSRKPSEKINYCSEKGDIKNNYKYKKSFKNKVVDKKKLSMEFKENNNAKKNANDDFQRIKSDRKKRKNINVISSNNFETKKIKIIKQKILILFKAKGGVGSTTISIFLSYIFDKVKTLLVDLNFSEGGGDISYYLDIPKSPNILNFIDGYSRESLENSVVRIKKNLDILQTPPTYEMSKKLDLQDIYCLTDIAKKKYHLIIFDLPNRLDDLLLGVIELADLLIMVSDNTLGSISRLMNISNHFLYEDLEKILIINKYHKTKGFNLLRNQIEQFFNLKDFVFLNEDEILRKRSEFSSFSFNNLKSFNCLTDKIFNLLTCD